jgi:hypothetical protein
MDIYFCPSFRSVKNERGPNGTRLSKETGRLATLALVLRWEVLSPLDGVIFN